MRVHFLPVAALALVLSIACGRGRALGDDIASIDDASPQQVVNGMANKLVRGVANLGTGWLEFPKQIYLTSQEEGVAKGATVGPIKGIGMTLVRTAVGAGEALTFFVAYPGFFNPVFDPSYVWQKE